MIKKKRERDKRIAKKGTDIDIIALKCHVLPLMPKDAEKATAAG